MKKTYHCKCGTSFSISDTAHGAASMVTEALMAAHRGPGHGETDARTAARARREADHGPDYDYGDD